MKHYFYFKKGQPVPQWLIRQRFADTMEVAQLATFKVNGKVMVDDETGKAIIWPASKRMKCVIHACGYSRCLRLDTDDKGSMNYLFGWCPDEIFGAMATPLARARRHGHDIRTTTKCLPIPEHFERQQGAV